MEIRSLSDLKRKLKKGQAVKLIYTRWGNTAKLNKIRYVVNTQGNGVYLNENPNENKGSFLEFSKASLFEPTEKGFKFFLAGERDLNEKEKEIKFNEPEDTEQEERDLMADTNIMFYRRKHYYSKVGYEYLQGLRAVNGYKYNSTTGKVLDPNFKGELSVEYEFID